jgi:Mycobacterium membrane protein
VAQDDSGSIGCRFVVDDAVKAETIAHEVHASPACLLRAA